MTVEKFDTEAIDLAQPYGEWRHAMPCHPRMIPDYEKTASHRTDRSKLKFANGRAQKYFRPSGKLPQ